MDLTPAQLVNSSWSMGIAIKNFPDIKMIDIQTGHRPILVNPGESKKTLIILGGEYYYNKFKTDNAKKAELIEQLKGLADEPIVAVNMPIFINWFKSNGIQVIDWTGRVWVDDAITHYLLRDKVNFRPKDNDPIAFACLNRRFSAHRQYLLSVLNDANLINCGYVTDNSQNLVKYPGIQYQNDLSHYGNLYSEWLTTTYENVPCSSNFINLSFINDHIPGRVILQCETLLNFYYPGEKSHQAFALRRIPITIGSKGSVQQLRDQGFDVYDDLIDNSYDLEPDNYKRIELAIKLNQHILKKPIDLSYLPRADYNYNHLITGAWKKQLKNMFDQLTQELNSH